MFAASRPNKMRAVASPTVAALAATLPFCAPAEKRVKINEQIRPLLNAQCVNCHGGVKEAGKLHLLFRNSARALNLLLCAHIDAGR